MDNGPKVNISNIEELVQASQAQDRDAFDKLVRLYQQRAMQVAIRMLGDANEAAEAIQDGFVRAYLNIGKLKEPKRFEAWLLRIITNVAVNQRRTVKRRFEKRVADCYEDNKTVLPVERGIAEELKVGIQRAMLRLSKKEAKAISLFGLEDLSHKEVSEIMDCSIEAARWYVFRARQKLRVLLKDYL